MGGNSTFGCCVKNLVRVSVAALSLQAVGVAGSFLAEDRGFAVQSGAAKAATFFAANVTGHMADRSLGTLMLESIACYDAVEGDGDFSECSKVVDSRDFTNSELGLSLPHWPGWDGGEELSGRVELMFDLAALGIFEPGQFLEIGVTCDNVATPVGRCLEGGWASLDYFPSGAARLWFYDGYSTEFSISVSESSVGIYYGTDGSGGLKGEITSGDYAGWSWYQNWVDFEIWYSFEVTELFVFDGQPTVIPVPPAGLLLLSGLGGLLLAHRRRRALSG